MDESTGFGSGACYVDADNIRQLLPYGHTPWGRPDRERQKLKAERVIFDSPATIVFWNDGTKTVVKCQECSIVLPDCQLARCEDGTCLLNMQFKSKGLAHAMLKKTLPGYLDTFKKLGLNL